MYPPSTDEQSAGSLDGGLTRLLIVRSRRWRIGYGAGFLARCRRAPPTTSGKSVRGCCQQHQGEGALPEICSSHTALVLGPEDGRIDGGAGCVDGSRALVERAITCDRLPIRMSILHSWPPFGLAATIAQPRLRMSSVEQAGQAAPMAPFRPSSQKQTYLSWVRHFP